MSVNWLTWTPFRFDGWTALTLPVLVWIFFSASATVRFTPQARRAWRIYRIASAERTNGGTVATAQLERLVELGAGLLISLLCLGAAVGAGHRERFTVLFLLPIPAVKLLHAELSSRLHAALLRALTARGH